VTFVNVVSVPLEVSRFTTARSVAARNLNAAVYATVVPLQV
jgi:hypothetical protein